MNVTMNFGASQVCFTLLLTSATSQSEKEKPKGGLIKFEMSINFSLHL